MSQTPIFQLDVTDAYELSMLYAALKDTALSNTLVRLKFTTRNFKDGTRAVYTPTDLANIQAAVNSMANARFTEPTLAHLQRTCRYFDPWFFDYLRGVRLDPSDLKIGLDGTELYVETELRLFPKITLWEIALLRIVSICYHEERHTFGRSDTDQAYDYALKRAKDLAGLGMHFIAMPTRRPPCAEIEAVATAACKDGGGDFYLGTSNVELSALNGTVPRGTTGHKYNMVLNGLYGIEYGTVRYLESWRHAFGGDLGIALPDTICTPFFFRFFKREDTHTFAGVRQDSGPAYDFTKLYLSHCGKMGVQPKGKQIIYSNFADNEYNALMGEIGDLKHAFSDQVLQSVGAGQLFLYFPKGLKPLNIVMKATEAQLINQPYEYPLANLVKLSDSPGKAIGDPTVIASVRARLADYGIHA